MSKIYVAGAIFLGLAVFSFLGAFGIGDDTAGLMLVELGLPEDLSNRGSRMLTGFLFFIAIFLLVTGWASAGEGRVVSHDEFMAAKSFVERQERDQSS